MPINHILFVQIEKGNYWLTEVTATTWGVRNGDILVFAGLANLSLNSFIPTGPPSQLFRKVFALTARSSPTLCLPDLGLGLVKLNLLFILLVVKWWRSVGIRLPVFNEEECVGGAGGGGGLLLFDARLSVPPRRFFIVEIDDGEGLTSGCIFLLSVSESRPWLLRMPPELWSSVVADL